MGRYLTADDILGAEDRLYFDVECPEWKNDRNPQGLVRCRSLTATERDQWEKSMDKDADKGASKNRSNARATLVSKVIVDENGERIFRTPAQILALGNKNVAAVDRIFKRVLEESKVSEKDLEELEASFPEEEYDDSVSN